MPATPSIDLERLRDETRAIEASVCVESFAEFVRRAWHVLEPTRDLLPSVAIDAMCAALQAVADGRIQRLAISTCPGTSKSLIGSVAFPAWLLLRSGGTARVMCGSYAWNFATRDSRRCRDLVTSEWFSSLVAGAWGLRADANRGDDWWTTATGRRLITSIEGKATGERCTIQIIDDALAGADIRSLAAKHEAIRWFNVVLPSRLEDQRTDQRVIIGQRLAVDDPIAEAIRQGWKYLYLPAVLSEDDTPCELLDDAGDLVWLDERQIGQPLVALLNAESLTRLRLELGATAFAAQYLQKPSDDTASIIKRTWWRFYRPDHLRPGAVDRTARPAGCDEFSPVVDIPERFDRITIAVDLTFGSTNGDYADISAWGASGSGRYLLAKWRARAGFEESSAHVERVKRLFPNAKVLIEKAANGWATIETLSKRIPGVIAQKPIGNKIQRLSAIAPTVESGCCYVPIGAPWLLDFVEELAGATAHDDQCDTTAYAILDLNNTFFEDAPAGGYLFVAGESVTTYRDAPVAPSDGGYFGSEPPPAGGILTVRSSARR